MLAPGTPDDLIEYIDVRDVADFVARVTANHITGAYQLLVPPKSATLGGLLETSRRVTGADTKITWASVEFLRAQGVIGSRLDRATPFPVWLPPGGINAGFGRSNVDRAVARV